MGVMGPVDRPPVGVGRHAQLVLDMYPFDHQDLVVELDLTDGVTAETTVPGGDAARLQRTPERAGQSTRSRRHHIIQGRGMRLERSLGGAVMGGDGPVHPEHDRTLLDRDVGVAQRPAAPLDVNHRPVHHLTHGLLLPQPPAGSHRNRRHVHHHTNADAPKPTPPALHNVGSGSPVPH
jgi:hypothetical protein